MYCTIWISFNSDTYNTQEENSLLGLCTNKVFSAYHVYESRDSMSKRFHCSNRNRTILFFFFFGLFWSSLRINVLHNTLWKHEACMHACIQKTYYDTTSFAHAHHLFDCVTVHTSFISKKNARDVNVSWRGTRKICWYHRRYSNECITPFVAVKQHSGDNIVITHLTGKQRMTKDCFEYTQYPFSITSFWSV